MRRLDAPRIILVTDPSFGDEVIVRCVRLSAAVLPSGWLCVQLRNKERARISLRLFALSLRRVTRAGGAWLVINGDPRLARDVDADGVHLGRGAGTVAQARKICGERSWVCVSAHSDDEVARGVDAGADAVLVSPVFSTRALSGGASLKLGRGLDALRSACAAAKGRARIYALGGVTPDNARACIKAGAQGVAVMRVLLATDEPVRVARALHGAVGSQC